METRTDRARKQGDRDAGFTLIEQIVAMSVLFSVLIGLLVALGAGARGIANGRQRTIATSLAKGTIETLQGSAYTSVAMNLSSPGLATDPRVAGTAPNLTFELEPLVGGSITPYQAVTIEAGATFTQTTFVTAVVPATGSPYRRITVIIDWTPSTSGNAHSMRFSSLAFPLDYTSYPAGSGSAEAIGAAISVSGDLGGESFDDLHLNLPGARATSSASTLRTAHGTASSSTGVIDVASGPVSSASCVVSGTTSDIAECVLTTADNIADNDAGSQTGNAGETIAFPFGAGSVATTGGLQVTTPAGTSTSRASTDDCPACTFGDADGVPWAEGSSVATTGSSASFSAFGATLTGALWSMGSGWSVSALADHDTTSGGLVASIAELQAPSVDVLRLDGVAGFTAAVKVPSFSATVSTTSGHTASAPSASASASAVEIWDGVAYQTFSVTPGVAFDSGPIIATVPIVIGDHQVQLTSRVLTQPSTVSSAGTSIKTESAAQYPSLMVVTVDVAVISIATGLPTATFTVTFDYGRTSALSTWIEQ